MLSGGIAIEALQSCDFKPRKTSCRHDRRQSLYTTVFQMCLKTSHKWESTQQARNVCDLQWILMSEDNPYTAL